MDAFAFVAVWNDINTKREPILQSPLLKYPAEHIDPLDIDPNSKRLLIDAGLPKRTRPFLSFQPEEKPHSVGILDRVPETCYAIGYDGAGNPICVDEQQKGVVVLFDHDNDFRWQFVNSSVLCLAAFLIEYCRHPDQERLVSACRRIDYEATLAGTFWASEFEEYE